MFKYYFDTEKEIESCQTCPCYNHEFQNCELRKYGNYNSCIKELKPKELEWFNNIDFFHTRNDSYTIDRINTGKDIEPIYRIFWHGLLLADRDLLNDAKQFCQDHYNKLFYEMIGE